MLFDTSPCRVRYMFVSLLGNKHVIRILDFMICNAPRHFSKSEMIAAMHMGRPSFYEAWKMLEDLNIVKAIDSEKNFRYYVLNKENSIVKTILKLHAQLMGD
jgi:Fe2+ or Zn2+ uptake regulation protein